MLCLLFEMIAQRRMLHAAKVVLCFVMIVELRCSPWPGFRHDSETINGPSRFSLFSLTAHQPPKRTLVVLVVSKGLSSEFASVWDYRYACIVWRIALTMLGLTLSSQGTVLHKLIHYP